MFKRLLRQAGLPAIRLYDLRHTSATLLLSLDVDIRVVSERLGHDDIGTILRFYSHALLDMQQRAIQVIEELFGSDCPTDVPRTAATDNGMNT